ncbi:alpha/beta fold hydrolase [Microbacterium sp.]|uniref:alpha/beta fold hydrolase n=1 Tax=Microbacterium sp. TaxID=51671 RepID=UPI0039E566F4
MQPLVSVHDAHATCVVLHGWDHAPRDWRFVARWLARERTELYCPDLRAVAARQDSPGGSPDRSAGMVDVIVEQLGETCPRTPVHLVGHSAGTALAAALSSRLPQVISVTLVDPVPRVLGLTRSDGTANRRWVGIDDERAKWALRSLRSVTVPVSIVRGEGSSLCPADFVDEMRLNFERIETLVFQILRCGHSPNIVAPAKLADVIQLHIDGTSRRTA